MDALKADYPLGLLLKLAGLPRSTYYYHQARAGTGRATTALDAAITATVTRVKGRYGHRRIHQELQACGWRIAKKTVLGRMRALGLRCQVRRKRWTSYRGRVGTTAPNRLDRAFTATGPNQKWVTDITEFRIGDDKLYLAPVLDLYDRQVIAYHLSRSPDLALATTALDQAIATLAPTEHPLVHTDQGFQYQHQRWQQRLASAGATASMSRKGNCLDNAIIENFFGHLKSELLLESFASIAALQTAVEDYIAWYNDERFSSALNGLSPRQYRAQTYATL